MNYIEIKAPTDLENLIKRIRQYHFFEYEEFLKKEGRIIYGYFCCEDKIDARTLIVFGEYVTPNEDKVTGPDIFRKLKAYVSSSKNKGLLDINGNIIIAPQFSSISLLSETRILGVKKGKYTVISSDGTLLCPIIYDKIFNVGENTLAFEKDGKRGFMNMNAEVVIQNKYEPYDESKFNEGKILVWEKTGDEEYSYYIDHYGLMVSEIIDYLSDNDSPAFGCSNCYVDPDLYDDSSAFEGDDSNRWNID